MSGIFHMMFNKIASAIQAAFAVDLDGTNDYFSRASDLTGNADGKTFTFSAWVYPNTSGRDIYTAGQNNTGYVNFKVSAGSSDTTILAYVATTKILDVTIPVILPTDTQSHILISIDLANTANRYVYVNDVAISGITWTTYTNTNIDFTSYAHVIGGSWEFNSVGNKWKGRVSNVFLDYTYRDLSNVTNRRLFITADRKPAAGQAALNPIIYLPMDDPATAHVNQGTGGNFTLNGTIARSGRGPNQFNVPYSDLDGAADYVGVTTAPTGLTNGKIFTFHCVLNTDSVTGTSAVIHFGSNLGNEYFYVQLASNGTNGRIVILGQDSTPSIVLNAQGPYDLVAGRNYIVTASIDLTDTAKRFVYINGQAVSMTWSTYSNTNIAYTSSNRYRVGLKAADTNYFNGRLGDVFFHTSYIDLSVPANLAKFVTGTGIDAKPVDLGADGSTPLGVQPLIYLPMYGNNAGKNYGSGGDFTVNSGPYTGARGPNEFWGNKADFDGSTGYLARTSALSGVSDGKTFSASFWVNMDAEVSNKSVFRISPSGSSSYSLGITFDTSYNMNVLARNAAGTVILNVDIGSGQFTSGVNYCVQIYVDLTNSSNRGVRINGSSATATWNTYTNDSAAFTSSIPSICSYYNGTHSAHLNGKLSEFYFTTEYIDFSQESNRLKFRDAFGNPVYLGADGSLPTGTAPAIYMRFDPAAQGTNSGTGGAFTKSGTISDGGQL